MIIVRKRFRNYMGFPLKKQGFLIIYRVTHTQIDYAKSCAFFT